MVPLLTPRYIRKLILVVLLLSSAAALPGAAEGQGTAPLSRWALGRPSLLIDLPGDPSSATFAWAERPMYSIFPNAWAAEGGGLRVEVARIYTAKDPASLLAEVGQKMGATVASPRRGQISGREFLSYSRDRRTFLVIGNDGGVLGGASWVVTVAYKDEAGKAAAGAVLGSIKIEREGARHWATRSFGRTFLVSELPFELAPAESRADESGITRYESSFDGMDVSVSEQVPSAGMVFEVENTLREMVARERDRAGVTDFKFSRDKYKLEDKEGEFLTIDFKRGYRAYRIYKIAFIDKRNSVVASIIIDPTRTDHQNTTERILRSFKTTINPIYGWKTYAIGNDGLYVDLPAAPSAPKQQGSVSVYESITPLAMTEIRELTVGFPSAHNPDFSARQYFEMQAAIQSSAKFELQRIEKRLVDGLEARLVKATWLNGKTQNYRQILTIYGYRTQWIIDMLATRDTAMYMDRVMESVRVKLDFPGLRRQSIGQTGVSFIVGDKPLQTQIKETPGNDTFLREETGFGQFGGVVLFTWEMVLKENVPPLTDERGSVYFTSFLKGITGLLGTQVTAKLRDGFPVNIDGLEGRQLIFDLTSGNMKAGAVLQGDFLMLQQDKKLWTAIILTNYEGGLEARYNRARILNTLRAGL